MHVLNSRSRATLTSAAALAIAAAVAPVQASTFEWIGSNPSGSSWIDPLRWSLVSGDAGSGYPNGEGDTAIVTLDIGAAYTLNLNAAITLNQLVIGDLGDALGNGTGAFHAVTINPGSGGSLTFTGPGARLQTPAVFTTSTTNTSHILATPVTIASGTHLTVETLTHPGARQQFTITGLLTGGSNTTITKVGRSALAINSNSFSTFTGDLIINQGNVSISGSAGSIGSSKITINANADADSFTGSYGSFLAIGGNNAVPAGEGRLRDDVTIQMNGGAFNIDGSNAAGLSFEKIGKLNLGVAHSLINMDPRGAEFELRMDELNRPQGSVLTVRINQNATLGGDSGAAGRILIDKINGDDAANAVIGGVIPWLFVGGTLNNEVNAGGRWGDFGTYDPVLGIKPIATSADGRGYDSATATTNVAISSNTTVSVGKTINSLRLAGNLTIANDQTITVASGGVLLLSGSINPQGTGAGNGTLAFGDAEGILHNTAAINVGVRITGNNGITKGGTGNLTLSGANDYLGQTTVAQGVLTMGAVNTLPSTTDLVLANSNTNPLNTPNTSLNVRTRIDLNNNDQTIRSLAGGGAFGGDVLLGSATLTLNGIDNTDATYGGVISGTGKIVKTGLGRQTLNGANTYTGGTDVLGGTLVVNGSIGGVTTVNGGTLGGNGSVGEIVLQSAGRIAPGNSIGQLTADSFTWNGGDDASTGQLVFELGAGGDSDRLTVNGPFARGTGAFFTFDFAGTGAADQTYTLLTFEESTGFDSFSFTYTNLAGDLEGTFTLTANALTFTTSAVPEPASLTALAAIGGLLMRRRRSVTR